MRGDPVGPGTQSRPPNLSPPDTANRRHISAWSTARTLAQKAPDRSIAGQLAELRDSATATNGGRRDKEKNDWQVRPRGVPSSRPVITVTPLANDPSAARKPWSETA